MLVRSVVQDEIESNSKLFHLDGVNVAVLQNSDIQVLRSRGAAPETGSEGRAGVLVVLHPACLRDAVSAMHAATAAVVHIRGLSDNIGGTSISEAVSARLLLKLLARQGGVSSSVKLAPASQTRGRRNTVLMTRAWKSARGNMVSGAAAQAPEGPSPLATGASER